MRSEVISPLGFSAPTLNLLAVPSGSSQYPLITSAPLTTTPPISPHPPPPHHQPPDLPSPHPLSPLILKPCFRTRNRDSNRTLPPRQLLRRQIQGSLGLCQPIHRKQPRVRKSAAQF